MSEIRTERGDLVPEKYVEAWRELTAGDAPERWFVDRKKAIDFITDLAHAEAKYAAAEQAWQKDAADKNKLVEMLTTRVRELEQQWVSVKERLPDERQVVLAYFSKRGVAVSSWFQWEDMEHPLWKGCGDWGEVTHWAPLPEQPSGEQP